MGNLLSPGHFLLLLLFALLFFGPSKLPELGKAFGKTLKEFKKGTREAVSDPEIEPRPEVEVYSLPPEQSAKRS